MDKLEGYVNELQCSADDVRSAIAGNNFHVFAKRGDNKDGHWHHVTDGWSSNMIKSLETHFTAGTAIFLGLSGNNSHYLLWKAHSL
jgi:hypothetical protein